MYQQMPMKYGVFYNTQQLQRSLDLIKEAVSDEKSDELFYDYLISVAPTKEDKEIIASIRDDEKKHNKMFRYIYKCLTGMDIDVDECIDFKKPASYLEGIKTALFGELKAVEKYRVIRQGLPNRYYRDMLFEIITDELKHSAKYNYLYTTNKESNMTRGSKNKEFKKSSIINKDNIIEYVTPMMEHILEEVNPGEIEKAIKDIKISSVLTKITNLLDDATKKVEDWEKN